MPLPNAITLQLTARGIDRYCRELVRRTPAVEKRVAEIDALITFLSTQTDVGEQAKGEFLAIRQTLLAHFEEAREALFAERGQRLYQALRAQQLATITALYGSLSRDAFWTLLGRIEPQFDAAALQVLRSWVADWLLQAQRRGRQASPYPDAIDFSAAGIDPAQFLTMSDLARYLGVETPAGGDGC